MEENLKSRSDITRKTGWRQTDETTENCYGRQGGDKEFKLNGIN